MSSPVEEMLPTKLCHIIKRPDFDGYGFNLHSEKSKPGQYIGKVDENSPAQYAGLTEGDRIIEVNGVSIGSETHKQVVNRIKAIEGEVRLLLIDSGKAYNIAERNSSSGGNDLDMTDWKTNSNGVSDGPDKGSSSASRNDNHISKSLIPLPTSANSMNANVASQSSLQLPTTAAEMRARLLSKKKFDAKRETVDLKQKYDIIQKL